MNSKRKGKRGELECAAWLRSHGFDARRGQQFHGGPDSPDVVGLPGFHVEVKRTERPNLRDAVAQAEGDSGGKPWVIFLRWNNGRWLALQLGEDWLGLLSRSMEPENG